MALVRLRLARALLGAAEANAVAAEAVAAGRGIPAAEIAAAEGLALHAAAFNGMPDPVFHLAGRAMTVVTGLAAIEPDSRAPSRDVILDAALQAATGLQQLLSFRHACTTATSPAEQQRATGTLLSAAAELGKGRRDSRRPHRAGQADRRVGTHRHDRPQLTAAGGPRRSRGSIRSPGWRCASPPTTASARRAPISASCRADTARPARPGGAG